MVIWVFFKKEEERVVEYFRRFLIFYTLGMCFIRCIDSFELVVEVYFFCFRER